MLALDNLDFFLTLHAHRPKPWRSQPPRTKVITCQQKNTYVGTQVIDAWESMIPYKNKSTPDPHPTSENATSFSVLEESLTFYSWCTWPKTDQAIFYKLEETVGVVY